jgi:hypothetical protein
MAYADNYHKMMGIGQQPIIADKVIEYLRKRNYKVSLLSATREEDMHDKIDYFLMFDESTPFGDEKLLKVPIDIKWGKTYTILDAQGNNSLERSKSKYLIYETRQINLVWNKLLDQFQLHPDFVWVNVDKLRKSIKQFPPEILDSHQTPGSKFFFMFDYLNEHTEILDKIS